MPRDMGPRSRPEKRCAGQEPGAFFMCSAVGMGQAKEIRIDRRKTKGFPGPVPYP
jgi:hypothetical protein